MITSLGTFCQYAPRVVGDEQQSANQAGNANYNAAPQVQQSFVVNQPPAITSGNSTTFAPGKTGQTFTVNTTGFPTGASMSITDGGGWPSGVTLTNNSNGHATIAGTPAAHTQDTSPYHVNITASNGISPDADQHQPDGGSGLDLQHCYDGGAVYAERRKRDGSLDVERAAGRTFVRRRHGREPGQRGVERNADGNRHV